MSPRVKHRAGQAMTESILLMPAYFLLVFGLLQLGQLATGLLVANYAASAIARQVVQDQTNSTALGGSYQTRYEALMTAGMKHGKLIAEYTRDGGLFSNVTVHACAEINAFPFVGEFLKPALSRYSGGCGALTTVLPFSFISSPPYRFMVQGKATARMNYQPR